MNDGICQDWRYAHSATGEDGRESKSPHPGQSSQVVINWLFELGSSCGASCKDLHTCLRVHNDQRFKEALSVGDVALKAGPFLAASFEAGQACTGVMRGIWRG